MLADIELAQTLKSETEKAQEEMIETVPHPLDQDYQSLKCSLKLMDKETEMFEVRRQEWKSKNINNILKTCCQKLLTFFSPSSYRLLKRTWRQPNAPTIHQKLSMFGKSIEKWR